MSFTVKNDKRRKEEYYKDIANLLKSVANETRLCVIRQLSQSGELSVSELMENMDCEQSLLSHHLADMRERGVLDCQRRGKNNYYSIKDIRVLKILKCIDNCGGNDILSNEISIN